MAQVYDYMKDIGPAAAEGLAEGYLRLRGAALALAERYGLGRLAGIAAGADGLMVEVHNAPPHAKCDGQQSLTPPKFDALMGKVSALVDLVGKTLIK